MMELSYRGHRFPSVVIQHAVWLYLRFTLSYRDVEDLLAELLREVWGRLIGASRERCATWCEVNVRQALFSW